MEQLNRIELRGNVGNVRTASVGNSRVANFSVATNYVYKNREGESTVETTWHSVVAWESRGITCIDRIQKGVPVYVCGRIRPNRYIGNDGTERTVYEVAASKVEILEEQPSII